MNKNDIFTSEKISIFLHMKNTTTVLFSLIWSASVVFIVTQTDANGHFVCFNACKFSASDQTIKCGFSFSELENVEQFSAKIILIWWKFGIVCLVFHVVSSECRSQNIYVLFGDVNCDVRKNLSWKQ